MGTGYTKVLSSPAQVLLKADGRYDQEAGGVGILHCLSLTHNGSTDRRLDVGISHHSRQGMQVSAFPGSWLPPPFFGELYACCNEHSSLWSDSMHITSMTVPANLAAPLMPRRKVAVLLQTNRLWVPREACCLNMGVIYL